MTTYTVITTISLERVYTVQARFQEEAEQNAIAGKYVSHEDLEFSEEVVSVEQGEE